MKRLLKILLIGVILILLLQVPFIYRCHSLRQTAAKVESTNPRQQTSDSGFNEYIGVAHVHSTHKGEISDAFDEMLNAACDNKLDFVLLTEHFSTAYDTTAFVLNGVYGPTLFVAGNEITTRNEDRFLMFPGGPEAAGYRIMETPAALEKVRKNERLTFLAYPETFTGWDNSFDGVEVLSLATVSRSINPFVAAFDSLWSYREHPSLAIARFIQRPDQNLRKYDELTAKRKLVMLAGLDAHSQLGFHILGDQAGNDLLTFKFDPYETVFRIARLHVLLPKDTPLTRESLLDAVGKGRFFNGVDVLGDTRGFRFSIQSSATNLPMGDEATLKPGMKLNVGSPIAARTVVIRNGETVHDTVNKETTIDVNDPGAYRVEVYRTDLGAPFDNIPWILSNPIYIR